MTETPSKCRKAVNGAPCTNYAVLGDDLCIGHGGRINRLVGRKLRVRAASTAEAMLANVTKLALTANSEAVRLRASLSILDMAGVGAPGALRLDEVDAKALLAERLAEFTAQQRELRALAESDATGDDVLDAEEVTEPERSLGEPATSDDPPELAGKKAQLVARLAALRAADRLTPED